MKKICILIGCLLLISLMIGCLSEKDNPIKMKHSHVETAFFGDSTAVFIAKELQNGYQISIIHNKQINLIHFVRGDSISQYCAIHRLPFDLRYYEEDSIGVFNIDIDIPVSQLDTLGGSEDTPDMFFMDVNFDGDEEFVVKHDGYNRYYYACFDLVNGNRNGSCPGLLESNNKQPYNNIVSGIYEQPSYTVFDRKKKEIYIYETMGCCSHYETWAKYFEGDNYGNQPEVKVVKEVHYDLWADGTEHVETYKLVNDSLKLVDSKVLSN